ncbi:MAG TPA: lytic transglycosylase domain-containing protein, partial [Xanthobacteraceae bacterium]|nr:lytic transglycosylase domain-containing protein [Xanthobacteraceae bacterium]
MFVRTSVARALRASAQSSASRHVLTWMLAAAGAGLIWSDTASAARPPHAGASRTAATGAKAKQAAAPHAKKARTSKAKHGRGTTDKIVPLPQSRPALADLPPGLAPVRQAFDLIRAGKLQEATAIEKSLTDPVAQTVVEWMLLRRGDTAAGFDRYAAFIKANPDWPGLTALRRRAEGRLWQERRDAATVRAFIGTQPAGVMGQLTLARVLMSDGDRAEAERNLRAAWRAGDFSADTEAAVVEAFPDVLTRADRIARMDRRIGAKDFSGAMRAAKKLSDGEIAIVKACIAAEGNASKAGGLLDGVPGEVRDDVGYALCRIHWRIHQNDVAGAARLMLAVPRDAVDRIDGDEWWR